MHTQVVTLRDGRRVIAKFRNCQPLAALGQLNAATADFRDYGDRAVLRLLGIFYVGSPEQRAARAFEAARHVERQLCIADAYRFLGLNRLGEYGRIVERIVGVHGFWQSHEDMQRFRRERDALDDAIIASAQRIRVSEQYHREIAGDEVVNAAYSLGA